MMRIFAKLIGIAAISCSVALISFAPPEEPTVCLKYFGSVNAYKLVIPGACYYNLTLEGDVYTCNANEPGICRLKVCYVTTDGCSYHLFEDPIE